MVAEILRGLSTRWWRIITPPSKVGILGAVFGRGVGGRADGGPSHQAVEGPQALPERLRGRAAVRSRVNLAKREAHLLAELRRERARADKESERVNREQERAAREWERAEGLRRRLRELNGARFKGLRWRLFGE